MNVKYIFQISPRATVVDMLIKYTHRLGVEIETPRQSQLIHMAAQPRSNSIGFFVHLLLQ